MHNANARPIRGTNPVTQPDESRFAISRAIWLLRFAAIEENLQNELADQVVASEGG